MEDYGGTSNFLHQVKFTDQVTVYLSWLIIIERSRLHFVVYHFLRSTYSWRVNLRLLLFNISDDLWLKTFYHPCKYKNSTFLFLFLRLIISCFVTLSFYCQRGKREKDFMLYYTYSYPMERFVLNIETYSFE